MSGPRWPWGLPTAAVVADVQRWAASVGLAVTSRCQHCGAPLWNHKSIAAHAGPTCRRRHHNKNDPGTPAKKFPEAVIAATPTKEHDK